MRRLVFWGVIVLPVVLVLGHPMGGALFGEPGRGEYVPQFVPDDDGIGIPSLRPAGIPYRFPRGGLWQVRGVDTMHDRTGSDTPKHASMRVRWAPSREIVKDFGCDTRSLGYGWPLVSAAVDYERIWVLPRPWYSAQSAPRALASRLNGVGLSSLPRMTVVGVDLERAIPTRVVWLGLFVNWLVAMGVCAALLMVMRTAVRLRRRMRGVCLACGYDVGALERCPECGAERAVHRGASA